MPATVIWVRLKTDIFETFGYVKNSDELDALIENDAIYAFRRKSGWVTIGKDPIRRLGIRQDYKGPERRTSPDVLPQCGLHPQRYVVQR